MAKWRKSVLEKKSIFSPISSPSQRILLALLTPLLIVLSFPGFDCGWLAWVALVPLLVACNGLRLSAAFSLGLLSGVVTIFGVFCWMFNIPGLRYFHAGIGAVYLGLYTAVWCAGISLSKRTGFLFVVAAPAIWVALDFLRSHAGFLSFPWASLAQSQHSYPAVLQIATITGEYGVTFVIVLINAAIAACLTNPGYMAQLFAGAVLASTIAFGAFQLSSVESSEPFRIAAVQPCIWPGEQQRDAGQANTLNRLEKLTSEAAAGSPRLIVWPETAVLSMQASPLIRQRLDDLSRKHDTALLVGASERVKFTGYAPQDASAKGIRSYNAAYLIRPGLPALEPYRKNRLVPFGEYLPLDNIIPWPPWFIGKGFYTIAGKELTIFEINRGVKFAALICWENLFPEIARKEVITGAMILVNLVNDGWFGRSSASRQHNSASVLRAVENRIPLIVASNCGPSQIIDAHGRILASSGDAFAPGVVSADVRMSKRPTFYTKHGDYFAWLCVGLGLLMVIRSAATKFTYPSGQQPRRQW
jgi:apolipoprotein N-acyltransferase